MKALRMRIQEECKIKKVQQYVVEKDYALSYVLAGIAEHPVLSRFLIFKGGTALKKTYFDCYRFSEDLDFSTQNVPIEKELENYLIEAVQLSKELLLEYGPFDIQLKRKAERTSHPKRQEAFNIYVTFPWQKDPNKSCRIKLEITQDELVLLPLQSNAIAHGYDEVFDYKIACYHIEEIFAEKLRTLLQTHQKIIRGWPSRPRDYYDLWRILQAYGHTFERQRVIQVLKKKCDHRDVFYNTIDDFFTAELIAKTIQHWQNILGTMILNLPDAEQVIDETKSLIKQILFIPERYALK